MRARAWVALAVACSLILGCQAPSAPVPQTTEAPKAGGRIVEAVTADVPTLQPLHASNKALQLLYEGLVRVDGRTGAVVPNLGISRVSADGRTYSWTIAASATWSDGRPITSEDFVVTIKAQARSKRGRAFLASRIDGFKEFASGSARSISGIQVDPSDPKRMTVVLEGSLCNAPTTIFSILIPAHVFGPYVAEGMGDAIDRAPENLEPKVVNGPFLLKEWRRNDRIVLTRNARYWRGAPLLEEYELKVVPPQSVVPQLRSGAVDLFEDLSPVDVPAIETLKELRVHRRLETGFLLIAWDTRGERVPGLRDKRVRQALAHAFDWQVVINEIYREGIRNNAHHSPSHWVFTPGLKSYAHDPARAEELLRAAGYEKDGEGIFARDGQRIEFGMVTNEGNRAREAVLQHAQDQYRAVGVRVSATQRLPFNELRDRLFAGEVFDAVILGWFIPSEVDTPQAWHSKAIPPAATVGPGQNFSRFTTPELDRALEAFRDGPDCSIRARQEAHAIVNRILNEEQPWDFGISRVKYTVTAAALRSFVPGVHNYDDVHLWWLAGK